MKKFLYDKKVVSQATVQKMTLRMAWQGIHIAEGAGFLDLANQSS